MTKDDRAAQPFKITRRATMLGAAGLATYVMFDPAQAQQVKPGASLSGEVTEGIVRLPDSQIQYFSQGRGEAVILLPGGSLSVGYLDGLAQELARAGYRAVRVNPRGAGKSTGSEANVTLHTFAADVSGVIQTLQLGRVNVAGHAFGNRVARMLAADQPQQVRSVVLLAAGGMVEPEAPAQRALNTIFNPASSEAQLLEAMKYMVGDPRNPAEDPAKAWQALEPSLSPKAAGIQGTAMKVTPLEAWWAPAGQHEYLVVQGSDDQAAPAENGLRLKQQLGERATIVTIPGAGHLMAITQPEQVAYAMVSFLRSQSQDLKTLADAYAYLLGRAIVIRQEQIDLKEPGITYNVIKYNPVGSADFANPNLDVAYMEAWIAVDDKTAVLLNVPEIKGRYYTAQILDEWGEVITNINERNYPSHPHGAFAFVAPGSKAKTPDDAQRIELHSSKAKMLARVEIKDDREGAVALQKRFTMKALGTPIIQPTAPMAPIDNSKLIGVELFDNVDAVIASASDVSPVAAQLQAKARDVARRAKDAQQRKALDRAIKEQVVPRFQKYAATNSGVSRNNWVATIGTGNYGSDYWRRSAANLLGIWANANDEVIYFFTTQDGEGAALNGANDYILHFPKSSRPEVVVDAYWSVILVDVPNYRVVPNPKNRFNFNDYSGLKEEADGSLKILFARAPRADVPESNWLPAPDGKPFFLNMRTYVPKEPVKKGEWFPPGIKRVS